MPHCRLDSGWAPTRHRAGGAYRDARRSAAVAMPITDLMTSVATPARAPLYAGGPLRRSSPRRVPERGYACRATCDRHASWLWTDLM
jgi:hypothetical protein